MKPSRLLYLCAQQLTAYRWQAGELTSEGTFAPSEDGWRQFAGYLRHNARQVFALLANVSEEGFHVETIPFLRGADRRAVIERKLGQLYFNSPLTTSLPLGYVKNRRKDERVLLTALANKDFFAPWLDAIRAARVALAGVYSLPLLVPTLLRRMRLGSEPCLLLSIQDQSVRQSYFENGELHFSRLAPLTNSSLSGIAQAFAGEAQKLQQYLVSQRLIGRQQPITAYLLAHANAHPAIARSCTDSATLNYAVIDLAECARRIGLRTAPADSHCEPLFLALLKRHAPRIQYADDALRHNYHLHQVSSALYALGGASVLGSALFCAAQLWTARTLEAQAQALTDEAIAHRQRYLQTVKTFPAIPTDTETLRRMVDRYAQLARQSNTPEPFYREISRALQAVPAAEIESIDWQADGARRNDPAASAPIAAGNDGEGETAIVRGTLALGGNVSARQVVAGFDALLAAFGSDPRLQVSALQRPFDVEPGKPLKSGDQGFETEASRAFAVQLRRRSGS